MKKKDILTGTIKRIDFPNVGIIEADDREIKVKNTLPGQEVQIQIQKARKNKYEARVLETLKASYLETNKDVCAHFGSCGGCLFSTLSYEDEISLKENQIKRLFSEAFSPLTFEKIYDGITPSPKECGYKNKMEFSFGDEYKEGPLALGMHKRGAFYDIVTANDCRICDEDIVKILKTTLSFFTKEKASFYNKSTNTGFLRHLLVRKADFTGEILVDLVCSSENCDVNLAEWTKELLALDLIGEIVGILTTTNDRISDVIEDQGTEVLYGRNYFYEKLLGLTFKISPFSFFQTNSRGAEKLYEKVSGLIGRTDTVFDLYSGTGTISQIISKKAKKVIGVEIVPEAVAMAKDNARLNKIGNVEFLEGDVFKVLSEIENKPQTIILDPPRAGVGNKALKRILDYRVSDIIYISCKPTSLAREYEEFKSAGYIPDYFHIVDMFPRTPNVECITRFVLEKP